MQKHDLYGYYSTPGHYYYAYRQGSPNDCWTTSQVKLNRKLRALWEQQVFWTRLTVNRIVGHLPDEKVTIERLLRNPIDLAEVLKPLYGVDIANKFAKSLTEHLTIAVELVKALQEGNTAEAANTQKRWFANADTIAVFLSQINPYWSEEEWKDMLYEHLRLLSNEVTTRLAGNYAENVASGDEFQSQALEMADKMTYGIIQQFPAAFTH